MNLRELINYLQEIEDSHGGHLRVHFTAINHFAHMDMSEFPDDVLYFNRNPYKSNTTLDKQDILYKDK